MKILSSKPESQSPELVGQDAPSSAQSNSPISSLFNMMLQASADTSKSDKKEDSGNFDASPDKNKTSADSSQNANNNDNSNVIAQLAMIGVVGDQVQPAQHATTEEAKSQTDNVAASAQQTASNEAAVQAQTQQDQIPNAALQATQAAEAVQVQAAQTTQAMQPQAAQAAQSAQAKAAQAAQAQSQLKTQQQTTQQTTINTSTIQEVSTQNQTTKPTLSDQTLQKLTQLKNNNTQTVATNNDSALLNDDDLKAAQAAQVAPISPDLNNNQANDQKLANKSNEVKLEDTQDTVAPNPLINSDDSDINAVQQVKDEQAIQAATQTQLDATSFQRQLDNQQLAQSAKYSDALVQLGTFINSHTMNIHSNAQTTTAQNVNATTTQSLYSDNLKNTVINATQPEYDLNVQLMPPSVDTMMREVYDAKIKISPPELGQVTAKLRVDKNSTELVITTENDRVKEIVQSNLPQLRENFQNADINLTHIDVQSAPSGMSGQDTGTQSGSDGFLPRNTDHITQNDQVASPKEGPRNTNALIDTYA